MVLDLELKRRSYGRLKMTVHTMNGNVAFSYTVGHIFEVIPGAKIMHTISRFESWEVRSPALQTVRDLEVKRRSYGHLKTTMQS